MSADIPVNPISENQLTEKEKEIEGLKIWLENDGKSAEYWKRQSDSLKEELADLGNQLTEVRKALWREEKEIAELKETLAEKEKEIGKLKGY